MASATIRSVHVATESTFARISSSGVPDASGASFAPLEFDRASLSYDGQSHEMNEMDAGRGSVYHRPPEPVSMLVSGTRVRRRTGTVSLRIPWRGLGAATPNYGSYSAMPAGRIISSGAGVLTPATTSDAVGAVAVSTTRWTPTAIASFPENEIGAGVAVDISGRKEFSFITDRIDGGTDYVIVSPAFSRSLTSASSDRVWNCLTLYSALGIASSGLGESVTLRLDGDGWRTYCYGGIAESYSWTLSNRCLYLDVVLRFAVIQDDHASATTVSNPTRADGQIAHALGSYVVITGTIGTTSPAELARASYGVDEWSFTWTNTVSGRGRSDDLAGISAWEVTDVTATASVTLATPSTTFDSLFLSRTEVSVMLGCGPTGQGEGACFYLPAAHLTSDAAVRDVGGERVRQTLNFRNGYWSLDDSSTAPADTSVRMAFPLKT